VASAPDLERVTGCYFVNSKPKRSSKASYDEGAAARLWELSDDLVGLSHHQRPQAQTTALKETSAHAALQEGLNAGLSSKPKPVTKEER
jgi:hypothetical protein